MQKLKINHAAVWVIVVLGQIIPAVWYGLFSESWLTMNDLSMEEAQDVGMAPYIVSIVTSVAFGYMLAWVFVRMGVSSMVDGLKTGLIMGFPIAILGTMTVNLFSIRPYGLTWLDGGMNLIMWIVAGLILGAWRKYE